MSYSSDRVNFEREFVQKVALKSRYVRDKLALSRRSPVKPRARENVHSRLKISRSCPLLNNNNKLKLSAGVLLRLLFVVLAAPLFALY